MARTPGKRASSKSDGAVSTATETSDKPQRRPIAPRKGASNGNTTDFNAPVKQQRADLDIEHFRSLLFGERAKLESEREQLRLRGGDMDSALPEEGEGGDEDTADMATAMMDKEMDLSVEEEIEDLMGAIDHALQKIEDGTYGICDMSGEPIPASRLELIPYASLTVAMQAVAEGD